MRMALLQHFWDSYGNGLKMRIEPKKREAYNDGLPALLLLSGSSKAVTIVTIRNGSKSRWNKDKD